MATSRAAKPKKLTGKQKRFVEEFLIDRNGTRAYQAVYGGSESVAAAAASRLLRNVKVADAVEVKEEKLAEQTELTQERVRRELATIAFADVRNYHVDHEGTVQIAAGAPDDAFRAIASIKRRTRTIPQGDNKLPIIEADVELKFHDKTAALRMAGQHLAMFTEKVDLTSGNEPLKFTLSIGDKGAAKKRR